MRRRDFFLVPAGCLVPALAQESVGPVEVPFRQVLLRDRGLERHARREFAESLRDSYVLGLQVFAREPGDALGALVEACARSGISVSYRYGVGRDPRAWSEHPEWRLHSRASGSDGALCLNSQYLQYLVARNEEILRQHPSLAGVVFDEWYFAPDGCSCATCLAERRQRGWNPGQQNRQVELRALERFRTLVGSRTVSVAGGGLDPKKLSRFTTHFEIAEDENPPSKPWYLRSIGKDLVAQVADAKSAIVAATRGYKVCLPLDGKPDFAAFQKLRDLEPWLRDARPVADIGVWKANEENCVRVLRALHHQFDVVDADSDLSSYRLIVVPDLVADDGSEVRLREYIGRGGAVFVYGSEGRGKSPKLEGSVLRASEAVFKADPWTEAGLERVAEMLFQLLPKPAIQARNVPASAEINMFEQRLAGGVRRVVHVTQDPSRSDGPLRDVQLWVRLPQHPLAVVTVPDLKPVEFVHNEFYTTFTIPRIAGHQAIAFE